MREQDVFKLVEMINFKGRIVETTLIAYFFEKAKVEDVMRELSRFQNPDGGFAYGLEPDNWNPNSNPVTTATAMNYFRLLPINHADPVIEKMFKYLENSYDEEKKRWPNLIKSNDDYPHAPWWSYRAIEENYNPTGSIVGFILRYAKPNTTLYKIANRIAIEAMDDIMDRNHPYEMHELSCLYDLVNDTAEIYKNYPTYQKAKTRLIEMIKSSIGDPSLWFTSYVAKPSTFIKPNQMIKDEGLTELLKEEFDLAMEHRNAMGIWSITWSWDHYPQEFKDAKEIWEGVIALNYLLLMLEYKY